MPEAREKQIESVWITLESPANRVSQGDLFYFEDEDSSKRYGIVVTADCDLTKRKHSKLVSFVPLLSLEEALTDCLYIDHLEKIRTQIGIMLHEKLQADVVPTDPAFSATIDAIIRDREEVPHEILAAADVYLHRSESISTQEFTNILALLKNSPKKAFVRFEQQINSRGDIILLTRPPLVAHDVRIAWLRRVWQVSIGTLALRTSEFVPNSNQGQHVARLASPFKYRLTQQFAQVFSDIGTPDVSREWIGASLKEKCNDD